MFRLDSLPAIPVHRRHGDNCDEGPLAIATRGILKGVAKGKTCWCAQLWSEESNRELGDLIVLERAAEVIAAEVELASIATTSRRHVRAVRPDGAQGCRRVERGVPVAQRDQGQGQLRGVSGDDGGVVRVASSAFREVSYEGLEEPGCAFASAYLSKLTPGTLITPHCGPCNARLRVHLALRIPEDEGRGGNGVNFWKKRRSSVVGQLAGGSRMSSSAGGADGCWRSGACCTRCTCSWCGRSSRRFVSRRGSWGRLGRSSGSDRRRCVFSPSAKKSYGGRKGGACSSTIASCTAPSTDNAHLTRGTTRGTTWTTRRVNERTRVGSCWSSTSGTQRWAWVIGTRYARCIRAGWAPRTRTRERASEWTRSSTAETRRGW